MERTGIDWMGKDNFLWLHSMNWGDSLAGKNLLL